MIIGIAGRKAAGKDTAAKVLTHLENYKRFAFADPLKAMCADGFDLDLGDMNDPILKEQNFVKPFEVSKHAAINFARAVPQYYRELNSTQRDAIIENITGKTFLNLRGLLQYVGTELMRTCVRDDFWIYVAQLAINQSPGRDIVITDMRFPNERKFIKEQGGLIIFIDRAGGTKDGHASESSLGNKSEYDIVIKNDGSLEQLWIKMLCFIQNQKYPSPTLLSRLFGAIGSFFGSLARKSVSNKNTSSVP